ncbi:unnamed protein product [Brugia timori]|uniref:Uncharacterized protein n=1 Tax=Brugia timori TaxID=42155 RepID=A0A0R3R094_9BILA|nr:unnamed protein product [Brugia timori]
MCLRSKHLIAQNSNCLDEIIGLMIQEKSNFSCLSYGQNNANLKLIDLMVFPGETIL